MGGKRPGAGRPKGSRNKATADVMAAAQVYTDAALKTLAAIMRKSDSDASRVAAASVILDRGHGKARQTNDVNITDERMVARMPEKAADADEWVGKHGPH